MGKEQMSKGNEKIFFNYILDHPEQIEKVEVSYFKDDDIQFMYSIIRDEYLKLKVKKVPSINQIVVMVKSRPEHKISNELLKILLKNDNEQYGDEWLVPRFKAWKLSNKARHNLNESILLIKGIDELNYDNALEITEKLKQMSSDFDLIEDDEDLGDDFDDPESHRQDSNINKIPSGWACMDTIMNGGWDYASLILLVGATNIGKSLWMNNIAAKIADQGKNVVYVTLEMAKHKCMKRMGSMRLKIPMSEYEEKARDAIFMKDKINSLKMSNGGLFENTVGKLFVKKYPTGSCTITELDNYITKLEQKKNLKLDVVIVDYINIMGLEKSSANNNNNLFLKGKHLAEGLRYIADKHNVVMITATQTDKDVWGASDLDLKDIPESKAVAETADVVWGIIRNLEMKKNNKYRLKIMKLRDGEHKEEQIRFDFNPTFMLIENDEFVTPK
jgi:replicative DNA helicase